jgi:hypothetical protein
MREWVDVVGGAACTLALAGAVVVVGGVTGSGGAAQCSKIAGPPNGSPLVSGRPATIGGVQAAAGFAVLVPDVPAARLANLTHAWVDDRRHVALVFAAGKVTITQAPATRLDAVTGFRRFVAQNPAGAAIGRVHGQPALVISPRTDGCGSNPAWIEFEHNRIDVTVYSASYGTGRLLAVAASLAPLPAPGVVTGVAAPCAGPAAAALQPVTVYAIRDGRTVATQVTQHKGRHDRYRFALAPGRYTISAPRSAGKVPQRVLLHSRQTITVNFPNYCD